MELLLTPRRSARGQACQSKRDRGGVQSEFWPPRLDDRPRVCDTQPAMGRSRTAAAAFLLASAAVIGCQRAPATSPTATASPDAVISKAWQRQEPGVGAVRVI